MRHTPGADLLSSRVRETNRDPRSFLVSISSLGKRSARNQTSAFEVADQIKQKIARLKLPKGHSFRTVLIYYGKLDPPPHSKFIIDFITI